MGIFLWPKHEQLTTKRRQNVGTDGKSIPKASSYFLKQEKGSREDSQSSRQSLREECWPGLQDTERGCRRNLHRQKMPLHWKRQYSRTYSHRNRQIIEDEPNDRVKKRLSSFHQEISKIREKTQDLVCSHVSMLSGCEFGRSGDRWTMPATFKDCSIQCFESCKKCCIKKELRKILRYLLFSKLFRKNL